MTAGKDQLGALCNCGLQGRLPLLLVKHFDSIGMTLDTTGYEQGNSWDLNYRLPSAQPIETMVLKPKH